MRIPHLKVFRQFIVLYDNNDCAITKIKEVRQITKTRSIDGPLCHSLKNPYL